jgi:hypothetical protein
MVKRMAIILAVLIMLGSLTAQNAKAGPPWPAIVFRYPEDGWCSMPWLNSNLDFVYIFGTGQTVWDQHNGSWKTVCHFFIDFRDPSKASMEQVCGVFPDLCKGNPATLHWTNFDCNNVDLVTYDSMYVVNPSGQATATCQFRP